MSNESLSTAAMWQAVINNDTAYDNQFVYAVRTTGVYCRPSCKSRRPKRENVEFFTGLADAQQAGYRACRKCQPNQPADAKTERIAQVCAYIQQHAPDGTITLQQLADEFHVSQYHLQRTFKAVVGVSPREYADSVRMESFKGHLREGDRVTDAIYGAGYGSSSRLYEQVNAHFGIAPASYRKGGAGAAIRYTTTPCALGYLLVATTERGVCAVRLGDIAQRLIDELHAEFPKAAISAAADNLTEHVEAVLAYISGEQPALDLPLDVQATAFQKQVWEALRQIPYGETRSYAQVAEAIGQPKAARAVGRACATNPVALVIPCHRVVKSDGNLNNYRWGIARKQTLLERERRQAE